MAKPFYVVRNDENSDGISFKTKKAVIKYIQKELGIKLTSKMLNSSHYFNDNLCTSVQITRFYEDIN